MNKNENNRIENGAKTTKFIIEDSTFSNCTTSLKLGLKDSKGGLMSMKNKKVRISILNSEFRDILTKSRNMLYLSWGENELNNEEIEILTITESIFTNCSAIIPDMHVIIENTKVRSEYLLYS
jgi:hypothetical protein